MTRAQILADLSPMRARIQTALTEERFQNRQSQANALGPCRRQERPTDYERAAAALATAKADYERARAEAFAANGIAE